MEQLMWDTTDGELKTDSIIAAKEREGMKTTVQ